MERARRRSRSRQCCRRLRCSLSHRCYLSRRPVELERCRCPRQARCPAIRVDIRRRQGEALKWRLSRARKSILSIFSPLYRSSGPLLQRPPAPYRGGYAEPTGAPPSKPRANSAVTASNMANAAFHPLHADRYEGRESGGGSYRPPQVAYRESQQASFAEPAVDASAYAETANTSGGADSSPTEGLQIDENA